MITFLELCVISRDRCVRACGLVGLNACDDWLLIALDNAKNKKSKAAAKDDDDDEEEEEGTRECACVNRSCMIDRGLVRGG